jgi:murein DD-endopeptidase MepM/ murein hydrolase activator NlpD
MRAKMAGAFVMGMAVGVLLLTVALLVSGSLNLPAVQAGNRRGLPAETADVSRPVDLPPSAVGTAPPPPTVSAPPNPATGASLPHLAMPLAGIDPAHITDTFNDSRDGRKHEALDIPAPRGTPVLAVAEGNVKKLFTSKQGGLTVYQFDDSATYSYYYAHLDHYAKDLKEGTLLRKGDVLGYVGSTGNASPTAPHLHFAVNILGADKKWWEGTPIDPLPLLR